MRGKILNANTIKTSIIVVTSLVWVFHLLYSYVNLQVPQMWNCIISCFSSFSLYPHNGHSSFSSLENSFWVKQKSLSLADPWLEFELKLAWCEMCRTNLNNSFYNGKHVNMYRWLLLFGARCERLKILNNRQNK